MNTLFFFLMAMAQWQTWPDVAILQSHAKNANLTPFFAAAAQPRDFPVARRVRPKAISAGPEQLPDKQSVYPFAMPEDDDSYPPARSDDPTASFAKVPGHMPTEQGRKNDNERFGGRYLADGSCPSWSPDGRSIVYSNHDNLKILNLAQGNTRRLGQSGTSPTWSPGDGRYIAFIRGRDGAEEIFVCEASGGPSQRLAEGRKPSWTADGRLLYVSATGKPQWYTTGLDHQHPAVAVASPADLPSDAGLASPDGSRLARQNGDSLVIVDLKTRKSAREWPIVTAANEMPAWSPDGRYLALAGFRCARGEILGVLDVEKDFLLCAGGSQCNSPKWSPDGSTLAFVVRQPGHPEIWAVATSTLLRSTPLAPACSCPLVPQGTVELIGPWHSPPGDLVPLDLSHHFNSDKIGEGDGNSLDLAAGNCVLAGVKFQIGSRMIQLRGQYVPEMPLSVQGIPVHQRMVRLYVLHAAQNATEAQGFHAGEAIAEYRVRYAGGDRVTIPVIGGQDVCDWWNTENDHAYRSQVAWVGSNKDILAFKSYLRLFLSTWQNPYPEKTVERIDYVSRNGIAAPFCLAMTVERPRSLSGPRATPGRSEKDTTGNR